MRTKKKTEPDETWVVSYRATCDEYEYNLKCNANEAERESNDAWSTRNVRCDAMRTIKAWKRKCTYEKRCK